ncbi:Auxin-responsive protein IAA12 [Sesamum alatum]|uniref:Auxin-responsive protein n=1 Tax=Sesamum alatum TaxID=300844 RepID=A0AAE1Y206_9LAMI|nr:Auxin-responsive protein IAA12 [Sesamum alatum]
MELELGLGLSNNYNYQSNISAAGAGIMVKDRLDLNSCFADEQVESKDLCSLLLWSGRQPNEDPQNVNIVNDEEIVINSVMRKELMGHDEYDDHQNMGGGGMRRTRMMNYYSTYVKVKMEGVGIGRKIDVTLYHSYQALTRALIHMFAKYTTTTTSTRNDDDDDDDDEGDYAILYQDKQGHWMHLPPDDHIVPWERFIEAVQRMKIVRK